MVGFFRFYVAVPRAVKICYETIRKVAGFECRGCHFHFGVAQIGIILFFLSVLLVSSSASAQTPPKVRMADTWIKIQMTPIYIMKDLDLPRKHGLDAEVLMIPVSSRAVQAALAGEIQFMTSGGIANINANMAGGDFVGITLTISTFVFKIIGQPGLKDPSQLKGKRVSISRLGGASDFSLRYALDPWVWYRIRTSASSRWAAKAKH
jgi:ABC-type nitrate/sulfonate/bicarbonate transport system substrate-binding protein